MAIDLFDTHCHTHEMVRPTTPVYEKWRSDGVERNPDDVIAAAHEVGVNRILCVGTTLADSELAIEFVQQRENMWASIGIHPHEATEALSHGRTLPQFAALAHQSKVIAVGECGLDYFYEHSSREDQIRVLKFQMALAEEANLPLVFHVRGAPSAEPGKDAFQDFWPLFEAHPNLRGVLHSFTDSKANLERAIGHGLYIGVNGIATFAKSLEKDVIYRTIPQQLLLLETDAPFLTPVPFRGKVCESKHLRVTVEYLSQLRGESLEELARMTTANARTLLQV